MWITFTEDYNWRIPGRRAFRQFKAGQKVNVPTPCAEDAESAGKGYVDQKGGKGRKKSEAASDAPENDASGEAETVFLTDTPETEQDDADTAA